MKNNISTLQKLIEFVNKRPGLNFADYGDIKIYRRESAEITRDRNDFFELLGMAQMRIDNFEEKLTKKLKNNTGDRLFLDENGKLIYHVGQYFPTEYRPAANRILVNLIWNEYREEKNDKGESVYKDGHEIRKAIKRNFSRRVNSNYFN
jgi:hypothetical protein